MADLPQQPQQLPQPFGLPGASQYGGALAGPPLVQLIQVLNELVAATNAQATILQTTSISGTIHGDVVGTAEATVVEATHLLAPLPTAQGGTGNATGQPSGSAGGDLGGAYPAPQVLSTSLLVPLPEAQGGTGVASLVGLAALEAYADGTWTPSLQFGGASTGLTYGTQAGAFTRIGRMVFCFFSLALTAIGSATGPATITGLPFPSNGDASNAGAGGLAQAYSNMAGLTAAPLIQVGPASPIASLLSPGAAATTPLTDAAFTNTAVISGSFSYFA